MAKAGTAVVEVRGDFDHITREMREFFGRAERGFRNMGMVGRNAMLAATPSRKANRSWQRMGFLANTMRLHLMSLTFEATRAFSGMIKAGVDFASTMETARLGLTALLDSEAEADKLLKTLQDLAVVAPYDFTVFVEGARNLAAVGVEAERIPGILEDFSNAAALGGRDSAALAGALEQLNQIFATGAVTWQDYRILAQNLGVDLNEALSQVTGIPREMIKQSISEGAISPEELVEAMGLIPGAEGAAEAYVQTFAGAMDNAKDQLTIIFGTAMQPVIGSIRDFMLGDVYQELLGTLGPMLTQLGNAIAPVVEPIMTVIGQIGTGIVAVLSQFMAAAGPGIAVFFEALGQAFEAAAPFALQLGTALGELVGALAEGLAPVLPAIGEIIGALAPVISMIGDALVKWVNAVVDSGLIDALVEFGLVLADSILYVMEEMGPYLDDLVEAFIELSVASLEILVALLPLIPVFTELMIAVLPVIIPLIIALSEFISQLAETFSNLAEVVSTVVRWIADRVQWVVDTIKDGFRTLPDNIKAIWEKIKKAASDAWNAIKKKFTQTWNEVKDAIRRLPGELAAGVREIGRSIVNGIAAAMNPSVIIDKIKSLGSDVMSSIKGIFGISSPSKEFMKVGEELMNGLVAGWSNGEADFEAALDHTARAIQGGASNLSVNGGLSLGPMEVRVFIGDTELRGMVRTEVDRADADTATQLAGVR